MVYEFEYGHWKFSEGGTDERLVYDRYSTPEHDVSRMNVGDTVVFVPDPRKNERIVGVLQSKGDTLKIDARDGNVYDVDAEHVTKPLDLVPRDLWSRWAKGAASVEPEDTREQVEDDFRWLVDGGRYSPGGRIQLALGQEHVTGVKANLSMFNCAVQTSPRIDIRDAERCDRDKDAALNVWRAVIDAAKYEVNVMRRGSGDGINGSTIPERILSPHSAKTDITFVLSDGHADYLELQDMSLNGKFDAVTLATEIPRDIDSTLHIPDDVGALMSGTLDMVAAVYRGQRIAVVFDALRHRGALVHGVNGRSSGAASWMRLYSVIAELLSQEYIDAVDMLEIFSEITLLIEQGGCVAPYTSVLTTGGYMTAESIYNSQDDVYVVTREGPKRVINKYSNGVKSVYRVEDDAGHTVDVSMDHKFVTDIEHSVLRPLRDLDIGETIVTLVDNGNSDFIVSSSRISSIIYIGDMTTYDFEVEDVHMLSFNGFYTSNSRRGALMLILSVTHANIRKFITRKQTPGKLVGANISVGVTDNFMDRKFAGDVEANEIYDLIVESAWKSAEPGVVFIERYNKMSNSWYYAEIVATNPLANVAVRI